MRQRRHGAARWQRARLIAALGALAMAAVALAACGGSKSSTTKAKSTPRVPQAKLRVGPRRQPLAETIVVVTAHSKAAATATARAGDDVSFRTTVPRLHGSSPVLVSVKLAPGPKATWIATASAGGQRATATLSLAGGKPLPLEQIHYACTLPPLPTICPARQVVSKPPQRTLTFLAKPSIPISLVATLGPAGGVAPPAAAGGAVVPAYSVKLEVAAFDAKVSGASSHAPFGASATAHPGDVVELKTLLKGPKAGAAQPVTITIAQGPGKELTVSASVPGGKAAQATVKSASGSPIVLVSPRYTCFVPPAHTFCPASKVAVANHTYRITFPASPTAPIKLLATAQAG